MKNKATQTIRTQEELASIIVESLEKGVAPWKSSRIMNATNYIQNYVTRKGYSFLNSMICAMSMIMNNQKCPVFISAKQAKAHNLNIKENAKSCRITYFTRVNKKDSNGEDVLFKNGNPVTLPVLRLYDVYNLEDTDISEEELKKLEKELNGEQKTDFSEEELSMIDKTNNLIEFWEKFSGGTVNRVNYSTVPFYSPKGNKIVIPNRGFFKESSEYCAVIFHEIIHATGAENHLNRSCFKKYSLKPSYHSTEELVAEIGSCMICERLGIPLYENEGTESWVSYCTEWASIIKDDPQIIFVAASEAKKAVDYIFEGYNI